ncbi:PTS fructose transporter subunit IIABC [Bacillus marinisedimentorum]|uniref:PTS fructose transporter subunit IIABC n=1 Tax=Bacillus marinisedimentorum TaxID=1821260 RepID=UPI0009F51702|nr:fructose-specific PTS transporter subunit EIIC [Bacillus marinisedimentorum]
MKISELLSAETIKLELEADNKSGVIDELAGVLDKSGMLTNPEAFVEAIWEREKESTTGIGEGIAIPHAKTAAVKKPAIAFGRSREGVDFDSLDRKPARLFFMIAAAEGANRDHLEALSRLSKMLLDDTFKEALMKAVTPEEVLKAIDLWEDARTEQDREKGRQADNDGSETGQAGRKLKLLAVTSCPNGIAHTYMAAENLEKAAEQMNVEMKVETQGSIGVENELTPEDIKEADGIIIAADKAVDKSRFAGIKLVETGVQDGINKPEELIRRFEEGDVSEYEGVKSAGELKEERKQGQNPVYRHLMNGVSYMIPFVVVGGLLIALSLAIGGEPTPEGLQIPEGSFWNKVLAVGGASFSFMVPILAGFISMSIADRPGLAPGIVGGHIAANGSFYDSEAGAGFLGGIVAGFIAGYVARWIKRWKVPKMIAPIMPILIIPLLASIIVAAVFIFIIGTPIAAVFSGLTDWLEGMQGASSIVLALILGAMIAFDMGGPVNKVAFLFGAAMIAEGNPNIMGPIAVAICVPPIGMGVATLLNRRKYEKAEQDAGKAAIAMGLVGITEGAIPFAAKDPLRVIPSIMIGSMVGAVIAMMSGVTDHVPHGGPVVAVFRAVENVPMFFVAIIAGVIVTALLVNVLKKPIDE